MLRFTPNYRDYNKYNNHDLFFEDTIPRFTSIGSPLRNDNRFTRSFIHENDNKSLFDSFALKNQKNQNQYMRNIFDDHTFYDRKPFNTLYDGNYENYPFFEDGIDFRNKNNPKRPQTSRLSRFAPKNQSKYVNNDSLNGNKENLCPIIEEEKKNRNFGIQNSRFFDQIDQRSTDTSENRNTLSGRQTIREERTKSRNTKPKQNEMCTNKQKNKNLYSNYLNKTKLKKKDFNKKTVSKFNLKDLDTQIYKEEIETKKNNNEIDILLNNIDLDEQIIIETSSLKTYSSEN